MTIQRIYAASLSDYNAGRLLGRWIDATQGEGHIWQEITNLLGESQKPPAEEWAVHDYEGFGNLHLGEFPDIATVAEVAALIQDNAPVFADLVNHLGGTGNLEEATRYKQDAYRGTFDSVSDYAEQLIEDCYGDVLKGMPEFIRYHIDFAGIAHDMILGGDIFVLDVDGEKHVFDANL